MEDLTKEPDSKHRMLMVSHTPPVPAKAVFVSKSCPDFVTELPVDLPNVDPRPRARSISLPSEVTTSEKTTEKEVRYFSIMK